MDDALDIARVGRRLLPDPSAAHDGRRALSIMSPTVSAPITSILMLSDKHAIAVGEKAVSAALPHAGTRQRQIVAGKRAHQHQQA